MVPEPSALAGGRRHPTSHLRALADVRSVGIRTAAVNAGATAALATVLAWGGLGALILDGFGLQDYPMLFAGAVMVAVPSLLVECSLAGVQRLSPPAGLRPSKSSQKEG